MPKLPWTVTPAQATGAVRFWKDLRALSVKQIAQEAQRPFTLALIGSED